MKRTSFQAGVVKHSKWAVLFFCALLPFMGCENVTEDKYYTTTEDLALTKIGAYGVTHPNNTAQRTNYILLEVTAGDYSKGTYTLDGTAVTPTPVLTNGGKTTLVKIPAPGGGGGGVYSPLTVQEDGTSVRDEEVTFTAAGTTAPVVLYGEKFMTFSEFFHDVTANITDIRPSGTALAATGPVAVPKLFINAGTRTGNDSAGTPNGTPKWTDTDLQPKVDVISSATYGDSAHFVPTQNLAMNYPDSTTKAIWHEVTGIKAVEVGVDFDLYANADLLKQANKAVAASTAVLDKADSITWKASTEVYKAKYLRPDASWGKRDDTAITEAKGKAWPKAIGGSDGAAISVSYGGTWADKVISVDFAPLPAELTTTTIWNDYFDYVYAAYVEDLETGHREPLVWLQNLFSHRGHSNLEAAIQRAGFSRLDSLSPAGSFKVVILAYGYKDIVLEKDVQEYDGQSSAAIEQGSAFYVSGTGNGASFLNAAGSALDPVRTLHITGLSEAALADFDANGGKLLKGTAEVAATAYELNYLVSDHEIEIELKDDFFTGAFQGSYSVSISSSAVYKTPAFTVNRIITRPQLQQDNGSPVDATEDTPITVTTSGGNIAFSDGDFAKAIVLTGRSPSAITIPAGGTAPAIGTVLVADNGVYSIKADALTSGTTYRLSIVTSNFVFEDSSEYKNLSPTVYYITVQ